MAVSNFSQAMTANARNWNNAVYNLTPDISSKYSGRLGLFFKAVRGLNIPRLYNYLLASSNENVVDSFVLACHIRDCRGGKGERKLGIHALKWLLVNYPTQFKNIISLIPEYGRWDDLLHFFPRVMQLDNVEFVNNNYSSNITNETLKLVKKIQHEIVLFFGNSLQQDRSNMLSGEPCTLAAKWAPTEHTSLDRAYKVVETLCFAMNINPKQYRTLYITPLRSYINVVESYMCQNNWNNIEYSKVPSRAMKRLKKAFAKHDFERFEQWKKLLSENKVAVNNKGTAIISGFSPAILHSVITSGTIDPISELRNILDNKRYDIIRQNLQ